MPNNNPTGKNQYSNGKGRGIDAKEAGRDPRPSPPSRSASGSDTQAQDHSSDRKRDGSHERGRR